jgi:hypothetical protein
MTQDVERNRNAILDVAARRGARNVRVFGSVARGDDTPKSDLHLLVEMERDRSLLDLLARMNNSSARTTMSCGRPRKRAAVSSSRRISISPTLGSTGPEPTMGSCSYGFRSHGRAATAVVLTGLGFTTCAKRSSRIREQADTLVFGLPSAPAAETRPPSIRK